jgi:hypothetical protein
MIDIDHEVNIWPEPYAAVVRGNKQIVLQRTPDREFAAGQILLLREWDPRHMETPRDGVYVRITDVVAGSEAALPEDLAKLSIELLPAITGEPR